MGALIERGAFVKVMPHDYKRVLAELAAPTASRGAGLMGELAADS